MTRTVWFMLCMCAALLLPIDAHAKEPSLSSLTIGGSAGSLSGVAGGAAFTASLSLLAHHERGSTNEYAGIEGGVIGALLSMAALPFWTAGGVKLAARNDGYNVSYRRACAGSMLGLLTYPLFLLPMLISDNDSGFANGSMVLGILATLFVVMPLTSALMARAPFRDKHEGEAMGGTSGAFMLSYRGQL